MCLLVLLFFFVMFIIFFLFCFLLFNLAIKKVGTDQKWTTTHLKLYLFFVFCFSVTF